jgi:hypothetical protein
MPELMMPDISVTLYVEIGELLEIYKLVPN